MHSADICCSVMITDLGMVDPKAVLDAAQAVAHFGAGARSGSALRSRATVRVAMVTHCGSRGLGGLLYKQGMEVAKRFRRTLSPATMKQNAGIPADTDEGRDYWEALQVIRRWT
jgi:tRNA-splicing ligase RtcB (3'-phosphate/5'-hydroxy nucleic acid ligase)